MSYQINPNSGIFNNAHLEYFHFAGLVLGKALFDNQIVDAHLTLPLYKHLLALPIRFDDLEYFDAELHKNLAWLRDNSGVDALCLDFVVNEEIFGENVAKELKPGGSNIEVTDENKYEYMELQLKYRMLDSINSQLTALLKGFYTVMPMQWVYVFDFQEIELLLCGLPSININDWRENSEYTAGYHADHQVIVWFWHAVEEFNEEQKARLLQYVTGTSRVPVTGFKALQGRDGNIRKFTIKRIPSDTYSSPIAHTCFNRIDLPDYKTYEQVKMALTFVIQMELDAGFTVE